MIISLTFPCGDTLECISTEQWKILYVSLETCLAKGNFLSKRLSLEFLCKEKKVDRRTLKLNEITD